MTPLFETHFDAPFGTVRLVASDDALVALEFPEELASLHVRKRKYSAYVGAIPDASVETVDATDHGLLALATTQLCEYFAGERLDFELPVTFYGTTFQVAAWKALQSIPYGETRSYLQQATVIGKPTATRAVGAANGRNPVAIIVPCHRVIGANGKLTGFGGGIDTKHWLLDHERRVAGASSSTLF